MRGSGTKEGVVALVAASSEERDNIAVVVGALAVINGFVSSCVREAMRPSTNLDPSFA